LLKWKGIFNMKILLVEDEVELADTFARFLELLGHDCVTAVNARQAIESVAQHNPEIVITDFCLPDGDGFDVTRHVCRSAPQTPVIFMTANHRPGMEEDAREAGAAVYLSKPLSLDALKNAVDAVVKARLS
jgi:DNA-binding response OmpR family regulator